MEKFDYFIRIDRNDVIIGDFVLVEFAEFTGMKPKIGKVITDRSFNGYKVHFGDIIRYMERSDFDIIK